MSQLQVPEIRSPIDGAEFDIRAPSSALAVLIAGLAILVVAAAGFYRGLVSTGSASPVALPGMTSAVVGAKPAVGAPQNPNWSVLNGPQVLTPATPKAAAPDSDSDDSDDADDQDNSADQSATLPASAAAPTSSAPPPSAPPTDAKPQSPAPTQQPPPEAPPY
jgi:hypothetical protein